VRGGDIFEEDAIFLQDEALASGKFVILAAERVGRQPGAIGFIGGEALDIIDAVSRRRRSLVRAVIADQVGTVLRNRLAPVAGIFGKRFLLEGSI